jgi:hypothetical protein
MGVGPVMVLRLVIYGAAMKPRASYGHAHKVVLLRTRRYRGLLVMIHYGATPMCYLSVSFSLVIFPYLVRRSLFRTQMFLSSGFGTLIVGYHLFDMLI